MEDVLSSQSSKPQKRTRVQLSCTACRSRKLKCCRTHPCLNCKRRGEADSCTYVGRGPRGRTEHDRTSPSHLQEKLQHLENLVMSFDQNRRGDEIMPQNTELGQMMGQVHIHGNGQGGSQNNSQGHLSDVTSPKTIGSGFDADVEVDSAVSPGEGKLVVKDDGTSYIAGAHWKAILQEISGMKEYLEYGEEVDDEMDVNHSATSPAIVCGINRIASIDELLADIPPRPVSDRLLARFLATPEPALVIVHIPTFQSEYDQFWLDPGNVSLPWLALLYSVMTIAATIYRRSEDPLPRELGDPRDVEGIFLRRTAQCLAQSNYTLPGKYKFEALLLHALGEFFTSEDVKVGVSHILSITARLAIQMGYHRDPRHYSDISVFDGEMRRRSWACVTQLDTIISFHVGLPKTIQDWQFDTELPQNLLDEDFSTDCERLPPARSDNERTALSYTRSKSRIVSVFGRITDVAYSRTPVTYEETLEMDRQLEETHDLIPSFLKMKPIQQSYADSSELIMRRYSLEFLYQKARCVLHRPYLAEARSNLRYTYSHWVCISAAKEVLRHQVDIHQDSQPGGQIYRDQILVNSIQNTDYLGATAILCLELFYDQTLGPSGPSGAGNVPDDLLATLEMSHRILEKARWRSKDSQKAYTVLSAMLQRVKGDKPDLAQLEQTVPQFESVVTGNSIDPALLDLGMMFPN